jgi:hypothetical protein
MNGVFARSRRVLNVQDIPTAFEFAVMLALIVGVGVGP